ncbi:hypothetical protein OK016_22205 [Vibrio chagasii]|nr:hypothetical protein [Vibrio chagasii]
MFKLNFVLPPMAETASKALQCDIRQADEDRELTVMHKPTIIINHHRIAVGE